MAISTNDIIDKFGTSVNVVASASGVADGGFSVAGTTNDWTNTGNAVEAALVFNGVFSASANGGGTINVHMQTVTASGSSPEPSTDYLGSKIASLTVDAGNLTQTGLFTIAELPNLKDQQIYKAWLENQAGQTIDSYSLYITPKTPGPSA